MQGRFWVTVVFSLTVLLHILGFPVFAQQANGTISVTLVDNVTAMGAYCIW
jgi:hypothetical protein